MLESAAQRTYLAEHGRGLLPAYLEQELKLGDRIVAENESWVALVPFWAVWPFGVMLLPLAQILSTITRGYNRIFEAPFPYSMGFHAAPYDGFGHPHWCLHAHFFPPLLRSAEVRKFMVGLELLGSAQRDTTPEHAAGTIRGAIAIAGD